CARRHGVARVRTVAAPDVLSAPSDAALANGLLAHADEPDDSHAPSLSHPGCAVVPAALAVGEALGIDGRHFLRAVALGYDVGPRVTMCLGVPALSRDAHLSSHSIAGAFGAAAAAGCAAALDAQRMRWLLDYTAQQSSGIAAWQRDSDHIEKAFVFGGMPARSGVTSALLVHAGWTGIDDIFSGPDNFLLAHAPNADAAALADKLGERYEVVRTNIKKWSVGSPIQAPRAAPRGDRRGGARRRHATQRARRGRARHQRQPDAARGGRRQMPRPHHAGVRRSEMRRADRARARARERDQRARSARPAAGAQLGAAARAVMYDPSILFDEALFLMDARVISAFTRVFRRAMPGHD